MPDLILHHYPQSPVSEKVRVVFGMKSLAWRSVEVPRLPPKPDLTVMTGGYRRAPVLQIGADLYCDTQCIIRELDRRFPKPTLYPGGGAGMVWGASRWTDGPLLRQVIAAVFGAQTDELPPEFAADRGRLYFGPDFDLRALEESLEHTLAQLRAQFGWMEQRLGTGRKFMLGSRPGLPDALCYYLVWFLRGRYAGGADLLAEFPHLLAWEARVKAIGHGQVSEMTAAEALEVAGQSTPQTGVYADPRDPQRLRPGERVSIVPDEDSGDDPVRGEVLSVSQEEIALRRSAERLGDLVVHFPRVGYRVSRI